MLRKIPSNCLRLFRLQLLWSQRLQQTLNQRCCTLCCDNDIMSKRYRILTSSSHKILRMNQPQKCSFSTGDDDLKNDKIIKEWMSEIMENFERAEKMKLEKKTHKVKTSSEKAGSDIDKLDKLGYTTEEYLKMLKEKGSPLNPETVNDEVSDDSDNDSDSDADKDKSSANIDSKKAASDTKQVDKDFSNMENEEWSVVVLNEFGDNDQLDTETENIKLETGSENDNISAEQKNSEVDDNLKWSEMEIEDFVNIAPPEVDTERWVPPISVERGVTGVFEVEELVTLLESLNAVDVVVIEIPPEYQFCDHMVIASGKSQRHINAMAADIKYTYKRKKNASDKYLRIEGAESNWNAMDMGNIVLHLFMPEIREKYDLETLWTLGPEHDPQCRKEEDPYVFSIDELPWLKELEMKRGQEIKGGQESTGSQNVEEKK